MEEWKKMEEVEEWKKMEGGDEEEEEPWDSSIKLCVTTKFEWVTHKFISWTMTEYLTNTALIFFHRLPSSSIFFHLLPSSSIFFHLLLSFYTHGPRYDLCVTNLSFVVTHNSMLPSRAPLPPPDPIFHLLPSFSIFFHLPPSIFHLLPSSSIYPFHHNHRGAYSVSRPRV